MNKFDFTISDMGELVINPDTHDIRKAKENALKIQLSYNRIKSITNDWFIDEIGADLEELIGKPCTEKIAEYGKQKIIDSLTFDKLWDKSDIFIRSEIKSNIFLIYNIFLKIYTPFDERKLNIESVEIDAELDLVKGVHIRYGWEPRRD